MRYSIFSIFSIFLILFCCTQTVNAQKKVIQIYGIVRTSDTTSILPGASIQIKGSNRGTIANDNGIYSIAVSSGDQIIFSFIGFKKTVIDIPSQLNTDQLEISPILLEDTTYLPTAIVNPLPTADEFRRIFLSTPIVKTQQDIARENLNIKTMLQQMRYLPRDAQSIYSMNVRQQIQQTTQRGLVPSSGIFNPLAWASFIRSLKEGGQNE